MINIIWFSLLAIGIIVGALNGNIEAVTEAAINNAKTAVEISIGLIGIMTLWLGIMKIAEDSGLVKSLSRGIRFIMIPLFPEIPPEHPAMGAMIMNFAANILGLGNAATPLGLKAMKELQTLNRNKDTATNAMVTFTVINTSSITLIPASVIAIRTAAGSLNPTEIIGPTLIATGAATLAAIVAVKLLQNHPAFRIASRKNKTSRKFQRW